MLAIRSRSASGPSDRYMSSPAIRISVLLLAAFKVAGRKVTAGVGRAAAGRGGAALADGAGRGGVGRAGAAVGAWARVGGASLVAATGIGRIVGAGVGPAL